MSGTDLAKDDYRERAIQAYRALARPATMTEEEFQASGGGSQPVDMEKVLMATAALLASVARTIDPSAANQKKCLAVIVKGAHDILTAAWGGPKVNEDDPGATRQ